MASGRAPTASVRKELREENAQLKQQNADLHKHAKRLKAQLQVHKETIDMSNQVLNEWRAKVKSETEPP
jgi:uncharacterized coiled-coil DUF342 family protein